MAVFRSIDHPLTLSRAQLLHHPSSGQFLSPAKFIHLTAQFAMGEVSLDGYNDVGCELSKNGVPRKVDWETFQIPSETPVPKYEKPDAWTVWREQLNSPRYVLAPMVDGSPAPTRMLVLNHGVDACWSPMIHARMMINDVNFKDPQAHADLAFVPEVTQADAPEHSFLLHGSRLRKHAVARAPELGVDPSVLTDKPMVAQFCANVASELLLAVKQLEESVFLGETVERRSDAIPVFAVEVNFGCPQRIARRGYYGSYLQENFSLQYELISTLHRESRFPVFAKIRRMPGGDENTIKYVEMLLAAGAQCVTVHGRRRTERGCNKGPNNWDVIKSVATAVNGRVPVVFNGGISTREQADRAIKECCVDAVMVGDGLLKNPAMFDDDAAVASVASGFEGATEQEIADRTRGTTEGLEARCALVKECIAITRALYEDSSFCPTVEQRREGFDESFKLLKGYVPGIKAELDNPRAGDARPPRPVLRRKACQKLNTLFKPLPTPDMGADGTSTAQRTPVVLILFGVLREDLAANPDLREWATRTGVRPLQRMEEIVEELLRRKKNGTFGKYSMEWD